MTLSKDYRFKSERLNYRGIAKSDAHVIVCWRSNPANYRYFLTARSISLEEHLTWFERYINDPTRFDFIIEDSSGKAIGTCGLSAISAVSCEISYMIGEETARGKGYATETVRTLTDIAFKELGVDYVDARILPNNEASLKVVQKGGFYERERVFRIERP